MKRIRLETAKLAAAKGYGMTITTKGPVIVAPDQAFETISGETRIYDCPYQEELQEWLREEKGIHICIDVPYVDKKADPYPGYYYQLYYTSRGTALCCQRNDNQRSSYEETLEVALTDALNQI